MKYGGRPAFPVCALLLIPFAPPRHMAWGLFADAVSIDSILKGGPERASFLSEYLGLSEIGRQPPRMTDPSLRYEKRGGIPQRIPHIPRRITQFPVRLFVAEPTVSRQRVEGIPGIERRLLENLVIGFSEGRRPLGKPQRQHRFDLLAPSHLVQRIQQLPHAVKPIGEDITLSFSSLVNGGQNSRSHVPYIDKIVSTLPFR